MEEKTIELPEEIFSDGREGYESESYKIVIKGETGYLWAVYGNAYVGRDVSLTIKGIAGSLPVACCVTEWDAPNARPMITDAIIELKSVQRSQGVVRIIARNASTSDRHVIMGIVFSIEH